MIWKRCAMKPNQSRYYVEKKERFGKTIVMKSYQEEAKTIRLVMSVVAGDIEEKTAKDLGVQS